MNTMQSPFYVTGGTLAGDAPSYVERQADRELYIGLKQGQFCYILTSRQMGKSSLMVHTADRLRQENTAVAILDLTAIGQNLSAEQWYDGLLGHIARQFNLDDELEDFWLANLRIAPLQRFTRAIREVVLLRCTGRVVIFVDEIDAVQSLPFSTDEFFAAIRECYNRRTEDAELSRLTFCLLGVATPSDLIQDTRTTPFNVGQRIELRDFTEEEAAPLAKGLTAQGAQAVKLLQRILYWTGGHPYLTQRMCVVVADHPSAIMSGDVDRICEELFLSSRARERDDNLLFVRERMLRCEVDLAGLLDLYGRVWRKPVIDDETNPIINVLRLSGVSRVVNERLQLRNRIYQRVFDRRWVEANMPGAEKRRQRRAFRRGLLRAGAALGVILVIVSALGLFAWNQTLQARKANNDLREQRNQQEIANQNLQKELYKNLIALAERELSTNGGDIGLAGKALADCPESLRGWEWNYLMRLRDGERPALTGHESSLWTAQFSPDGKRIATASSDGTVKVWDSADRRCLKTLTGYAGLHLRLSNNQLPFLTVAFSPDGSRIAAGSMELPLTSLADPRRSPGLVKIWDAQTYKVLIEFNKQVGRVDTLAFSPDGKRIASSSVNDDHSFCVWDVNTGAIIKTVLGSKSHVHKLRFSPDGRTIAGGCTDGTLSFSGRVNAGLQNGPDHRRS